MPTLHVRNVPESLYNRLQQRAEGENRSLSAEVIVSLDFALKRTRPDQRQLLDSIRRRRFFNPAQVGVPDSTTLLREERGR